MWGASIVVWAIFTVLTLVLFQFPIGLALLTGFFSMVMYWLSELVHQIGHALAARGTGYPMSGITFGELGGFIGASRYPKDEPPLPPMIHIRRALGGPIASAVVTMVALIIWRLASGSLPPVQNDPPGWGALTIAVTIYTFVMNLFIYTLQVFIPLSFNDGGTIWRAWRQRHEAAIRM